MDPVVAEMLGTRCCASHLNDSFVVPKGRGHKSDCCLPNGGSWHSEPEGQGTECPQAVASEGKGASRGWREGTERVRVRE